MSLLHASDSSEQRQAEEAMLTVAEQELGIKLDGELRTSYAIKLDGFCDGETPVCVEAWAHQGTAKGSQPAKLMADMCKLLLVEKLLARPCRKIILCCNREAVAFLSISGWKAGFAKEFGVEVMFARIPDRLCNAVSKAQIRQCR